MGEGASLTSIGSYPALFLAALGKIARHFLALDCAHYPSQRYSKFGESKIKIKKTLTFFNSFAALLLTRQNI
jgi:hypothetical protein